MPRKSSFAVLLVFFACKSQGAEFLGPQLSKCFSIPKASGTRQSACLASLGFGTAGCEAREKNVICSGKVIETIFPKLKGFANLQLFFGEDAKLAGLAFGALEPQIETTVEGFEIRDHRFSLFSIVSSGPRTWQAARPSFSYTLDRVIKSNEVAILGLDGPDNLPWKQLDTDRCTDPPIPIRPSISKARRTEIMKAINFDENADGMPQRQFVGRNGPEQFPLVNSFITKTQLKLCGVEIPKGKTLGIGQFTVIDCESAVDGTLKVTGLSATYFPKEKFDTASGKSVSCGPGGRSKGQFEDLAEQYQSHKKVELPVLDWTHCECYQDGE